jgi:hypothetical protein
MSQLLRRFYFPAVPWAWPTELAGLVKQEVQNRRGAENEQDSEQEPFVRSLFQFDAMHGAILTVRSISPATYVRAPVENKQKVTEHVGNGSVCDLYVNQVLLEVHRHIR